MIIFHFISVYKLIRFQNFKDLFIWISEIPRSSVADDDKQANFICDGSEEPSSLQQRMISLSVR